jgi:RNA polymerase sigma factor (sigma-70 family)
MSSMRVDRSQALGAWPEALLDLYRDDGERLTRLATLICGSRAYAEEAVHDAFLATHAHWASVRDPGAYLTVAVANGARMALRGGRRTLPLEMAGPRDQRDGPGEGVHDMRRALAALSERERTALILRYYGDLDHAAIAAALGCRIGTARSLVARGLAHLRKELS